MKLLLFFLVGIAFEIKAQTNVPFDSQHWKSDAQETVQDFIDGQNCIRLTNGTMLLKDQGFMNGIIDFDIAVDHARYFPGIGFRMEDKANGEIYYIRPHQSGNPDAMQYYPEYNGSGGWQLYYGDGFNQAHVIPFRQWMHIRILVKDTRAEVYYNHEKDPVLVIASLQRKPAQGSIGLMNEFEVPAWYANFSYQKTNAVQLSSPVRPVPELSGQNFTTWAVSSPFDEKLLSRKYQLHAAGLPRLLWNKLKTDERGVADLSRLAGASPGKNTVIAKQIIYTDKPEIKQLSFGFSDRVKVYFNGRLIYSGKDDFLSRDYRFLGTMGFFDAVYLPLKKGKNELLFAVSEDSGGWGLQARLEKLSIL